MNPWVIAGLAAAAYYAYSQGWFTSAAASTTTTTAPPIPPTVNTQNILPANVMALNDQAAYQAFANQNGMTYAQIQTTLAQVLANYQACAAPNTWSTTVVSATDLPVGCVAPPIPGSAPGTTLSQQIQNEQPMALSGLRVGNISRRHINAARYRI